MTTHTRTILLLAMLMAVFGMAELRIAKVKAGDITIWCDCPCNVWCAKCSTDARVCTPGTVLSYDNTSPHCYVNSECYSTNVDNVYHTCGSTTCCSTEAQATPCPFNGYNNLCYNDCGGTSVGCGKSCGGTVTCSVGNCINGVCVNSDCPSDSDCVCGDGGTTHKCNVSLSGTTPVEIGQEESLTSTISMTNSTAQSLTVTLGDSSTSMSNPGSSVVTKLAVPSIKGDYTATAIVTGSNNVSCQGNFDVTVEGPDVVINVWETNSLVACTKDGPVGGKVRLYNGSGFDKTQTLLGGTTTFLNVSLGQYIAAITPSNTALLSATGCPGSLTSFQVVAGSNVHDFFFTTKHAPWWQIVDGDGHASSVNMATPNGMTLLSYSGADVNRSGVLAATGAIDTDSAVIGPTDRNWAAKYSIYESPKEGFDYFVRSFELGVAPTVDNADGSIPDDPGADGVYTVKIYGDGSPKTLALSAPNLTPNLMIV